ncbi:phosphopentomutase, partial [Desmospora sp. 8437]
RAGWPVHLIGKMQDVITCEGAETFPGVDTDQVMRNVRNRFSQLERGLIAATVQETDLAGHAEDVNRYARKIMQVDRHLGPLLDQMGENDLLLISADHGNDPTAGHSQHTREKTFILSYNQKRPAAFLGHRSTLSDIAATLSQFFRVPPPENGTGFYKERK